MFHNPDSPESPVHMSLSYGHCTWPFKKPEMFSVREAYCWPIETAAANRIRLGKWTATKWSLSICVCWTETVVSLQCHCTYGIMSIDLYLLFLSQFMQRKIRSKSPAAYKHTDVYLCLTGPYFRRSVHATVCHWKKQWRVIILLIHSNTWKMPFVEISLDIAFEREPKAMNWQLRLDCR